MPSVKTLILLAALLNFPACAGTNANRPLSAEKTVPSPDANTSGSIDTEELAQYYGFAEMEPIKLDWQLQDLQIADFNRDGRNDIAVANNRNAKINLLLQQASLTPSPGSVTVDANDIDINELTPLSRFRKADVPVSQRIASLVTGDFNSDGLTDLAFYGQPPRALYVLLQKSPETKDESDAKPAWQEKKTIDIDDGLLTSDALVAADINCDGRDDLLLAGNEAIYLLIQKENHTLAEPVKYPTTARTLALRVGDLNGDARPDLVLITDHSDKPLHVRFGLPTGRLGPQRQFFIEKPVPRTVTICNFDRKGPDEIFAIDAKSYRLLACRLTCEQPGRPDLSEDNWPTLIYPLEAGGENAKRRLALGDFDGDNLTDLVISDPEAAELVLYEQSPELGLTEPVNFPAFADIHSLAAGDIDSDGKAELAVLSVKEKALGITRLADKRLSFPRPLDLPGEPLAMDLADIDTDGKLDLMYIFKDPNGLRNLAVLYNPQLSGNARPAYAEAALPLEKLLANPDELRALDADQDGLTDCLVFVKYEEPIFIRQVEKGKFKIVDSPAAQAGLIKEAAPANIAVADVDDAPGAELLIAQSNFARSLVFNDARWQIIDQYNAKSRENNISAVAAFDLDSDSVPEILLLDGRKGSLQILSRRPDGTYRLHTELDCGTWDIKKMLFAELTASGQKSILLFDGDKFAVITPPAAAGPVEMKNLFNYETEIKDGAYGHLAAGDINSDHRTDLIMVEYKNNNIEILTFNDNHAPVPAMRFKIFEEKSYRDTPDRSRSSVEPRQIVVADVTDDRKADLVTLIHDRIIIYPQD